MLDIIFANNHILVGEPDDFVTQNCLLMDGGSGYAWNDRGCSLSVARVCEIRGL